MACCLVTFYSKGAEEGIAEQMATCQALNTIKLSLDLINQATITKIFGDYFSQLKTVIAKSDRNNPEFLLRLWQSKQLQKTLSSQCHTPAGSARLLAMERFTRYIKKQLLNGQKLPSLETFLATAGDKQLQIMANFLIQQAHLYDLLSQFSAYSEIIQSIDNNYQGQRPDIMILQDDEGLVDKANATIQAPIVKEIIKTPQGIGVFLRLCTINRMKNGEQAKIQLINQYLHSTDQEIHKCILLTLRQIYSDKRLDIVYLMEAYLHRTSQLLTRIQPDLQKIFDSIDCSNQGKVILSVIPHLKLSPKVFYTTKSSQLLLNLWADYTGGSVAAHFFWFWHLCSTTIDTFLFNPQELKTTAEIHLMACKHCSANTQANTSLMGRIDALLVLYRQAITFYENQYKTIRKQLSARQKTSSNRKSFTTTYCKTIPFENGLEQHYLPETLQHKTTLPHHVTLADISHISTDITSTATPHAPIIKEKQTHRTHKEKNVKRRKDHKLQKGSPQAPAQKCITEERKTNGKEQTPRETSSPRLNQEAQEHVKQPTEKHADAPQKAHHKNHKKKTKEVVAVSTPATHLVTASKRTQAIRLQYDPRVTRWFNPEFASLYGQRDTLYHTFAPTADRYIIREGIKSLWQNRTHENQMDPRYSLPGQLTQQETGPRYAIFHVCMDQKSIIYHRGITFLSGKNLIDSFGSWTINMMPHVDDHTAPQAYQLPIHEELDCTEYPFHVVINDRYNNAQLTLFRIAAQS